MITLGVHGFMGSGKSYICRILTVLHDIPVFNCDMEVKKIVNDDTDYLRNSLVQLCGHGCYIGLKWNPIHIAELAKKDRTILDKIGAIIEPYLIAEIDRFKLLHKNLPLCVIESALFGKSEALLNTVDKIVLINAPLDIRIKRIMARDPRRGSDEIITLLYNQIAPSIDIDYVIENGDDSLDSDVEGEVQKMVDDLMTYVKRS